MVTWGLVSTFLLTAAAVNLVRMVVVWGDHDEVVERAVIIGALLALSAFCAWREHMLSPPRVQTPGAVALSKALREGMAMVGVGYVLLLVATGLLR